MFEFQSHLIFPTHAVPRAGPFPPRAQRLSLKTKEGQELVGIHIPADEGSAERTLILGFGGNAWNAQDVAEYLHQLFPDEEVVVFHYRGYSPSQGSPSAEALIADAPLVYDNAVEEVRPGRVVAVGFSIGSGIAAALLFIERHVRASSRPEHMTEREIQALRGTIRKKNDDSTRQLPPGPPH